VEAGARDDRHGRAALHANVAACLRRGKAPAEAVAACDAALSLLPRFGRALFRRAVCLLEAGRPAEALAGFEALYRVDRKWPRLPDWLLRAVAAKRRAEGGKSPFAAEPPSGGGGGGGGSPRGGGSPTPGRSEEEETARIAAEKDHYAVLGVTTDATEKELKSAYRMRSLKYHPDKAGIDCTAAFQRIALAYAVLSDGDKRADYDQGKDVKASRKDGKDEDDSEEEAEEHRQSLREEVNRKYYPELFDYWPFGGAWGPARARATLSRTTSHTPSPPRPLPLSSLCEDPFLHKRKLEAQKARKTGASQWHEED
jgi:tetratricopeptide (TPR) repeat protein